MRSNPADVPPSVDFPSDLDPTPPDEREKAGKFSTSARKSERQIGEELERFDVDEWYIDDAPLSSGNNWPGYVVRWRKEGVDYALVSDAYTTKKANARAAFYWLKETRKRQDRPVTTAHDALAAAALPSQDTPQLEAEAVPPGGYAQQPHEILGCTADASPDEIQDAYRSRVKEVHPDTGKEPDATAFKRVKEAKEEMMDEQPANPR